MHHFRSAVLLVLLLLVLAAPAARAGSDVCNNVCTNDETASCATFVDCNFDTCGVTGTCTGNPTVACQTNFDCVGGCGVCTFQGLRNVALGQALLSITPNSRLRVTNIGSGDAMNVPVDGVRFSAPPAPGGLARGGHEPWIELGSADWEEVGEPPDTGDAEIRVTPRDAKVYDGNGGSIDADQIVSRMFDEAGCSHDGASCKKSSDCGDGNTCDDQSQVCSHDASIACSVDGDCGSENTCVDIMKISVDFSSTQPASIRYVVRDAGGNEVLAVFGPGSETDPVLARDWPAGMQFSEYKWEADVTLTVTKNVCSNDDTVNCQADGDCTDPGTCSDTRLETVTGRGLEIYPLSSTYDNVVLGTCENRAEVGCDDAQDCAGTCNGSTCSNDGSVSCSQDSECDFGACQQDKENKADITLRNIDTETTTGLVGPVVLPDTFIIIREAIGPPAGASCDDGDPCTVGDTYVAGVCIGQPLNCFDGNPCTADSCNGGVCQNVPRTGQPCDDGDSCTSDDSCDNFGVCRGSGDCSGDARIPALSRSALLLLTLLLGGALLWRLSRAARP